MTPRQADGEPRKFKRSTAGGSLKGEFMTHHEEQLEIKALELKGIESKERTQRMWARMLMIVPLIFTGIAGGWTWFDAKVVSAQGSQPAKVESSELENFKQHIKEVHKETEDKNSAEHDKINGRLDKILLHLADIKGKK